MLEVPAHLNICKDGTDGTLLVLLHGQVPQPTGPSIAASPPPGTRWLALGDWSKGSRLHSTTLVDRVSGWQTHSTVVDGFVVFTKILRWSPEDGAMYRRILTPAVIAAIIPLAPPPDAAIVGVAPPPPLPLGPEPDDFLAKLVKLLPTETVTAYVIIDGALAPYQVSPH